MAQRKKVVVKFLIWNGGEINEIVKVDTHS